MKKQLVFGILLAAVGGIGFIVPAAAFGNLLADEVFAASAAFAAGIGLIMHGTGKLKLPLSIFLAAAGAAAAAVPAAVHGNITTSEGIAASALMLLAFWVYAGRSKEENTESQPAEQYEFRENAASYEPPKPPANLGKHGKKFWKKHSKELADRGMLTDMDTASLELCSGAYQVYRDCWDAVFSPVNPATGRRMKRTLNDYLANSSGVELRELWSSQEQYLRSAEALGLTPASRRTGKFPRTNEAPLGQVPAPPRALASLGKHGKKFWEKHSKELAARGMLTELDAESLELCSGAYQVYRDCWEAVFSPVNPATGRRMKRTLNDYLENSSGVELRELWSSQEQYLRSAEALGLTPASRSEMPA